MDKIFITVTFFSCLLRWDQRNKEKKCSEPFNVQFGKEKKGLIGFLKSSGIKIVSQKRRD